MERLLSFAGIADRRLTLLFLNTYLFFHRQVKIGWVISGRSKTREHEPVTQHSIRERCSQSSKGWRPVLFYDVVRVNTDSQSSVGACLYGGVAACVIIVKYQLVPRSEGRGYGRPLWSNLETPRGTPKAPKTITKPVRIDSPHGSLRHSWLRPRWGGVIYKVSQRCFQSAFRHNISHMHFNASAFCNTTWPVLDTGSCTCG